jgi:hypothetical protein
VLLPHVSDLHTVTRFINKAGAAAGLAHIYPHQLRHTLATQAINPAWAGLHPLAQLPDEAVILGLEVVGSGVAGRMTLSGVGQREVRVPVAERDWSRVPTP